MNLERERKTKRKRARMKHREGERERDRDSRKMLQAQTDWLLSPQGLNSLRVKQGELLSFCPLDTEMLKSEGFALKKITLFCPAMIWFVYYKYISFGSLNAKQNLFSTGSKYLWVAPLLPISSILKNNNIVFYIWWFSFKVMRKINTCTVNHQDKNPC